MRHSVRCLAFLMACGLLTFCAEGATYKVIVLDEGEEVAYGLGVWVADGVLLTSAAIVKQGDQFFIEDPGTGVRYVAEVMSSSSSMALLSVSGLPVSNVVTLASGPPQENSHVHVLLPQGDQRKGFLILETTAGGTLNSRYRFTMNAESSEVGAPVMNRCEELVSIVTGQTNSSGILPGVSYSTLVSYLRENDIDYVPSSVVCPSVEDQISQAQDSSKSLRSDLDSLSSELEILQDSIEVSQGQSAEQLARLESQKSALERRITSTRSELEEQRVKQDSLVARQDSLLEEGKLRQNELDSLKRVLIHQDSLIQARQSRSDSLEQELIEEEKENLGRLRLVVAGAALLVLVALGFLFLLWKRRRDAEEELTSKDSQLQEAEEELAKKSATFPDILLSGFGLGNEEIRIKISGEKLAQSDEGVILGRSSQHADCVIVENSVSRRHASVRLIENKVVICDLKSLNGTIVNGLNLVAGENYALEHGSKIILGDVSLEMTILQ